MIEVYLFDWGDTLMVDFPDASGKMCDWQNVEAVSGAKNTLAALSKHCKIYIATGAADSTELEIKLAFERVGLSQFISGYFCKANLGLSKGSAEFLQAILTKLDIAAKNVAMVGDNFEKDIKPATAVGMQAFWLSPKNAVLQQSTANVNINVSVNIIKSLTALHSNLCN